MNSWNEGGDCNKSYAGAKQDPGIVCLMMLQKLQEEILKSETITPGILIEQMNTVLDEGFLSCQDAKHAYLLSVLLF